MHLILVYCERNDENKEVQEYHAHAQFQAAAYLEKIWNRKVFANFSLKKQVFEHFARVSKWKLSCKNGLQLHNIKLSISFRSSQFLSEHSLYLKYFLICFSTFSSKLGSKSPLGVLNVPMNISRTKRHKKCMAYA